MARLGPHYHAMRVVAGAIAAVWLGGLGLVWGWAPGLYVALLALGAVFHAVLRRSRPGSAVEFLVVDTTALIAALVLMAPPVTVAIPPLVALIAAGALFLGDRRAVWLAAYATLGAAAGLTWTYGGVVPGWTATEALALVGVSVVALLPLMWWLLKETAAALSERRTLEARVREEEARHRMITESASDAIVAVDEGGTIVYANPAVQRIFGHPPEELEGGDLTALMPERFRDLYRQGFLRYLQTGRRRLDRQGLELTGLHRDGTELTLEVSFGEFAGPDGRRFIGTLRDVTERRRTEEALRASEARYRGLFEGVPVGVYRTSPEGRIRDVNPTLVELLGLDDREELVGRYAQEFYADPGDRERWLSRLTGEGVVRGYEMRLRRADGKIIWVRDSGREVRDDDGELLGYEGTIEDVTLRRRAEGHLQTLVVDQQRRLRYEQALSTCSQAPPPGRAGRPGAGGGPGGAAGGHRGGSGVRGSQRGGRGAGSVRQPGARGEPSRPGSRPRVLEQGALVQDARLPGPALPGGALLLPGPGAGGGGTGSVRGVAGQVRAGHPHLRRRGVGGVDRLRRSRPGVNLGTG